MAVVHRARDRETGRIVATGTLLLALLDRGDESAARELLATEPDLEPRAGDRRGLVVLEGSFKLDSHEARRAFLENIEENACLLELAREWGVASPGRPPPATEPPAQ